MIEISDDLCHDGEISEDIYVILGICDYVLVS